MGVNLTDVTMVLLIFTVADTQNIFQLGYTISTVNVDICMTANAKYQKGLSGSYKYEGEP